MQNEKLALYTLSLSRKSYQPHNDEVLREFVTGQLAEINAFKETGAYLDHLYENLDLRGI